MAFMAEPVVGATAGAVPPAPGYFKRIREICNTHGVLLVLDEVMCGMGRTGTLFACEQDEIAPDIVCIAKGLGAGYQPIGAMLCTNSVYQTIADGTGFFQHGHTYLGHPVACAAGRAVVSAVLNRGLLDRVQTQGVKLTAALHERFGQNPHVGDIRGRGLFQALEFVADRETKTPFDPSLGVKGRQEGGLQGWADLLSHGWNGRWASRRPCAGRAAVHHRGLPDHRAGGQAGSGGEGGGWGVSRRRDLAQATRYC